MTLTLELSETFEQELKAHQDHLESLIPEDTRQILRSHFNNGVLTSATSYLRSVIATMRQIDLDEFEGKPEADFQEVAKQKRETYTLARKALQDWEEFLDANNGAKRLTSYLRYQLEVREIL